MTVSLLFGVYLIDIHDSDMSVPQFMQTQIIIIPSSVYSKPNTIPPVRSGSTRGSDSPVFESPDVFFLTVTSGTFH